MNPFRTAGQPLNRRRACLNARALLGIAQHENTKRTMAR